MFMPGGSVQYTFHYGKKTGIKNDFSIGGDFLYQTLDEYRKANLGAAVEGDTKLSDETFKQTGIGVFALDRIEFSPKLSAFLSVRYDDIKNKLEDHLKNPYDFSGDENFSRTTGKIGLTFSPKDNINIYANWGTGFMPPATEELALNPIDFGGFNKNLVSATSMGEEIGARVNISRYVYFDLAFFHLKTENDFDRYRIPERPLKHFTGMQLQARGSELNFSQSSRL
jgi:outer membrane receptor protein involved in Fe transport